MRKKLSKLTPEGSLQVSRRVEPTPSTKSSHGITRTGPRTLEVKTKPLDELLGDLCVSTGVSHFEVAARIAAQTADSLHFPNLTGNQADSSLIQAIGMITELAPQNLTESMLAAQMIATHEKALVFLKAATGANQTFDGQQAALNFATRLMRLHLDQIEAMQKLKGKSGQQKVIVEHVHVHVNEGGQAIVGAVGPEREGGGG